MKARPELSFLDKIGASNWRQIGQAADASRYYLQAGELPAGACVPLS